jgi:hypothetical protein
MKKFLTAFALLALTLSACAPSADRPSLKPLLIKLDKAVSPGEVLAIQGRYLGGPQNSQVVFNADDVGANGVDVPASSIVSWTSTDISVKVPAGTRPTGRFLYVRVGGVLSNGLPYSVNP